MEPGHDKDGRRLWISPELMVGDVAFNYSNTRLRIFGDDWAFMNHVEHIGEDGQLTGILTSQEFMDTLFEANFPYQFQEYPDQESEEWFIRHELDRIVEDTKQLF